MSFSEFNLNENIIKAIDACGYTTPTPIQAKTIPEIIAGKDIVASAQTGSGKTAAFVLPALHRLSTEKPSRKPRILILTPTRELSNQIMKAASTYGKFLRFNIISLVGGMSYHHQIKDLQRGADIIVATPGRLLDHIEQRRVDLSSIEMLVLDEADRMLDMGFIEDVETIANMTPVKRQTLLFSATVDKQLGNIVKHLLKSPIRIDLSNEKIAAPKITQEFYKANSSQQKMRLLKHFLNDVNIFKAIIFTATKINADRLAGQLCDDGYSAAALHGDLRQNVRSRTLEQLRRGKIQYLVATDVAARGIDISDITHVINYDLPRSCEDYVHRIGRTGRAGKTGIAISFALPTDMRQVQRIERYTGQRVKIMQNIQINDASPAQREDGSAEEFRHSTPEKRDYKRDDKRRTFADRDGFARSGERRSKSASREGFASRNVRSGKPAGDRDGFAPRGERRGKPTGDRDSFAPRGERRSKPAGDRDSFAPRGERRGKPAGDRDGFAPRGERRGKPAGDRDGFAPRGERRGKPAGDRDGFARRGKPSGDRDGFAPRGERRGKPAGERDSSALSVRRKKPAGRDTIAFVEHRKKAGDKEGTVRVEHRSKRPDRDSSTSGERRGAKFSGRNGDRPFKRKKDK